jgi:hypothetical protein
METKTSFCSSPASLLRDHAYKGEGPYPAPPTPTPQYTLGAWSHSVSTWLPDWLLIQECLRKTGSASRQVAEEQGSCHFKKEPAKLESCTAVGPTSVATRFVPAHFRLGEAKTLQALSPSLLPSTYI